MRVMALGVSGMLGNAVFRVLSQSALYDVWGTLRDERQRRCFGEHDRNRLIAGVDVLDLSGLIAVMNRVRPEAVINCVGLIKQLAAANDPLRALPLNAMFPHQLAGVCGLLNARLIHLSSDCVFSGRKGNYIESDLTDAEDLYGRSKALGEVQSQPHTITLRTSGIGHELDSANGLLEWFLAQHGTVKGYARAIYSGLPSVELARVIRDYVLPHAELKGLFHVSAKPIAKSDLLRLVADAYGKNVSIAEDDSIVVDRSLVSQRFTDATGYVAPEWPALIQLMHESWEAQGVRVSGEEELDA